MRTLIQKPKASQRTKSAKSTVPSRAHIGQSREVNSILHLQRTIGNQAVQRMLQTDAQEPEAGLTGPASPRFGHDFSRIPIHPPSAGAIQTKLAINKLGDSYEQEADRLAEQVMRTPESQLQRAWPCGGGCPKCQSEQPGREHKSLSRQAIPRETPRPAAHSPSIHPTTAGWTSQSRFVAARWHRFGMPSSNPVKVKESGCNSEIACILAFFPLIATGAETRREIPPLTQ